MTQPVLIKPDISAYRPADLEGVLDVILPIQTGEFGVSVTRADQPDLENIEQFYQTGTGGFWVARYDGEIVGTIGLKDIGSGMAALRKMFVKSAFRGGDKGVASGLLAHLLDHARDRGIKTIWLGTTAQFLSAHRFYEKHGFREVAASQLPESFPKMEVDSKFYSLRLG